MARVLHAGFHKTGSSFLQSEFFPKLKNVLFIQKLDLARVRLLSDQDTSIIFSNEATCGYPYPLTEEFSTARLQTLNEKYSWSLEEFISQNRKYLLTWKEAPKAIAKLCQDRGTKLLVIEQSDLYKDQGKTLQKISAFIDGSTFDAADIRCQVRSNVSRYGTTTIRVYRMLNCLLDNRLGRGLQRVVRRSPRKLIQGRPGAILDRLSSTRLSSVDVDRLMQ